MAKNTNINIDYFISYREAKKFCSECSEICSRHCAIWRNAEQKYNEYIKGDNDNGRKA